MVVIGLSLNPCCTTSLTNDANGVVSLSNTCCSEASCTINENKSKKEDSKENRNGCDFCSPFFSCGSCGGFILQENIIQLKGFFYSNIKIYCDYFILFNSEYSDKMWQPPKIS